MSDVRFPQSSTDHPDIPQTLDVPLPAPSTATLPTQVAGRVAPTADSGIGMPSVPGFTIVRELGRGGMGVVYQGRHIALSRDVALKMILGGDHASASERGRFRSEAEAVARLQHPGIVQIYEIGESDGRPFFALEFCSGGSLAAVINGTPLEPLKAACLAEALAQAMAAAHQHGILHRDLKPANVLLDASGTPKIADFGLAKKIGESGDTASGAVLGTPSYMAPEQAMGRIRELGPAADIYALGAILYEMLTGRPPFRGSTAFETLEQVVLHEPVPPSQLNAKAPLDLETICLKCLRKEAAQRYRSAGELADDLRRFQNGEPIHARPVGTTERLWRWTRRNPALAGISAALLLSLVAGTLVAWYFALQADERADDATENKNLAELREQQANANAKEASDNLAQFRVQKERADNESERAKGEELKARRLLYVSQIRLAQRAWLAGEMPTVRSLLEEEREFRGFEWHYLWRLCHGDLATLFHKPGVLTFGRTFLDFGPFAGSNAPFDVAFAVGGKHVVTTSSTSFFGPSDEAKPMAGAFGDAASGRIRVWDVRTGKAIGVVKLPVSLLDTSNALALSHNGRRVAVTHRSQFFPAPFQNPNGGQDPHITMDRASVIDAITGERLLEFAQGGGLMCVAFNRDGQRLATGGGVWDKQKGRYTAGAIQLWSLQQGAKADQTPRTLSGHASPVSYLATARKGNRLASGDGTGVTKVWNFTTGKEEASIQHKFTPGPLALSPDGELLARCGVNRIVVWKVSDGSEQASLAADTAPLLSPIFSPDGQRLAAIAGRVVKLWDAFTGDELMTIRGLPDVAQRLAFSPNGRQLAACGDNVLQVWDVTADPERLDLHTNGTLPDALAFSPDGRRFAAGDEGAVKVWDARTGQEQLTLTAADGGTFAQIAYGADGRLCGLARPQGGKGAAGVVKVWDANGAEVWTHQATSDCMGFSPDGTLLALGGPPASAAVLEVGTGKPRFALKGLAHPVTALAFSPDGLLLATVVRHAQAGLQGPIGFQGADGPGSAIHLWDVRQGELLRTIAFVAGGIRFSPDSRRLAATEGGFMGRTVKVWNVADGKEVLTVDWPAQSIHGVAFSPDGRYLATGGIKKATAPFAPNVAPNGESQAVQLWELDRPGGAGLQLRLKGHRAEVTCVAFSHDGKRIVSGARDKSVKIWDAASGAELLTLQEFGTGWDWTRVLFAAGDQRLAAAWAGERPFVRLWQAETPANRAERAGGMEGNALTWHLQEGDRAKDNERPAAVRFHAEQAATLPPRTPSEQLRRGRLLSAAAMWTPAVVDYTAYLDKEKATAEVLGLRGHAFAALDKWDDANKDYARAVALKPNEEWIWSEYATLRLRAGDLTVYRQTCKELFARFIKADDLETIGGVAWTCSRGPGALMEQQFTRLTKRLEELIAAEENHEYDGTLGALCYRAGKLPKALKQLREVVAGENGGVEDSLFLAMTENASKQTTTAKATLAKARKLLGESKADGWREREERQLLRVEAEALVQGGK